MDPGPCFVYVRRWRVRIQGQNTASIFLQLALNESWINSCNNYTDSSITYQSFSSAGSSSLSAFSTVSSTSATGTSDMLNGRREINYFWRGMNYLWRDINYHVILRQGWGGVIGDCEMNIVAKRIHPPDQATNNYKTCIWKNALKTFSFGTQIRTFTNSNDFLQIKLIPVHSGVIPVSFRCHSGSFRCHSGSFRCHSGSFRSIPVSFRCHSGSFRFIPVHSGPFHLIPVHSAPFRCLVTPLY